MESNLVTQEVEQYVRPVVVSGEVGVDFVGLVDGVDGCLDGPEALLRVSLRNDGVEELVNLLLLGWDVA